MHREILPSVIFSPAKLAFDLAEGSQKEGVEVTLFSPGPVDTTVTNLTADLTYFEQELQLRGDSYLDLLKKHPFTFVTLSRQVQSELLAKAFAMANNDELDIVHVYTNEEDIALPFAALCTKPVVFTHHDPFNFLVKYKNVFPKYRSLNWISMSLAQRKTMPADTNWVGNIYHGIPANLFAPNYQPQNDYVAYLGRIIEPKGVHLAIAGVQAYNAHAQHKLKLKIAGKHYAGHKKDTYWQTRILPALDDPYIEYVGFMKTAAEKQAFLGNARALIAPSTFEEPFGMMLIESLACATPVICLASGAIPEVIQDAKTGILIPKKQNSSSSTTGLDESEIVQGIAAGITNIQSIDRIACRKAFEAQFTAKRMCQEHLRVYRQLSNSV
jgi:glycosyltransferase involved in cell wall biosynthesis